MFDNIKLKDTKVLIAVFLAVLLGFSILLFSFSNNRTQTNNVIDDNPLGTTSAIIRDNEELIDLIGTGNRYTLLTEDIYEFGVRIIDYYAETKDSRMTFSVVSVLQEADGTIQLRGVYDERTIGEVLITSELLGNDRLRSSIEGPDNQNVDSRLPSNSPENVFISTLPYENSDYTVELSADNKTYTIYIYTDKPKTDERAIEYIESKINRALAPLEEYTVIFPSWVTQDSFVGD